MKAGNTNEKFVWYRRCCFLQVWRTKLFYKPISSASNTFTVFLCLPAFFTHSFSLPLCTPHFSPHLLLSSFPILVDMLQLKVAPDESSFEASRAVGTSRRVLYICGFLVKLQISPLSKHLHSLRLYPSTVWWLAGIVFFFFFTIYFSSSTSITLDWRCPSDYKQLGKDILRCWGQGGEGKGERIEKGRVRKSACIPPPPPLLPSSLQSLHCICVPLLCYQPQRRGIFHVVNNFLKPSSICHYKDTTGQ